MDVTDDELGRLLPVWPLGASAWKQAGNTLIGKKNYQAAVAAYTRGLAGGAVDEALQCILYSNRAQSYLILERFEEALSDSRAAIAADPSHLKSHFRCGKALFHLGHFDEARESFLVAGDDKLKDECDQHSAQVRLGEYDWARLLKATIENPETEHSVSNYSNPLVSVVENLSDPNRGRGMVAQADLEPGTLVLVESAAAVAFPSHVLAKRVPAGSIAVNLLKNQNRTDIFELNLASNNISEGLVRGAEEYKSNPELYLKSLLTENGFAWWDSTKCNLSQGAHDHGYGLWLQAALFNHSCVANACYGFLGNLLVVRTVKTVLKDEEITLSYVSAHDSLADRTARLKRRGFQCLCPLCERQRKVISDDFVSASNNLIADFRSGGAVHSSLYYFGVEKLADEIDDFNVSSIVIRVIAALSCAQSKSLNLIPELMEIAYMKQTNEPMLQSLWAEDVNLCIQALFASTALRNAEKLQVWIDRLDASLGKLFPANVVEGLGNNLVVAYQRLKQAEEKAKQGPSLF